MAIVINGSGTITGISVGGLPDSIVDAGTLATNSVDSAELIDGAVDNSHIDAMAASKLTGALPAISGASLTGISAGKVLQVVSSSGGSSDTTSSSWTATGLSAAITPSATSSKVLIIVTDPMYYNSSANWVSWTAFRGTTSGTNLGVSTRGLSTIHAVAASTTQTASFNYLDSPSTTSATTYTVAFKNEAAAGTLYSGHFGMSTRTITLMEIAG